MPQTTYPFFIDKALPNEVAFPLGLARLELERNYGQIATFLSGPGTAMAAEAFRDIYARLDELHSDLRGLEAGPTAWTTGG